MQFETGSGSRRRGLSACAVLLSLAGGGRAQVAHVDQALSLQRVVAPTEFGSARDRWSSKIDWRTEDGWYATGVHATLLPDGRFHFIGYERLTAEPNPASYRKAGFLLTPVPLGETYPPETVVTSLTQPVDIDKQFEFPFSIDDDLFCTGNTLTSEGQLMTAGGTRYVYDVTTETGLQLGLGYATLFDPLTDAWTRVPADMAVDGLLGEPLRWYPAMTRLPDGRILVTAGYEMAGPFLAANPSAEIFDPTRGTWQVLSPYGKAPPEILNPDYPHPVVLPSSVGVHDLLVFGEAGVPVAMSTSGTPTWSVLPHPRPGTLPGQTPNVGASTLLLPIRVSDGEWGYANGSMLVAGGDHETSHQTHADVFDPFAAAWSPRIDMGVPRHHPTSILLPDGRVLIVSGNDHDEDPNVKRATYVDPADGFSVAFGTSEAEEIRGYHNVALLLPDGRVLVGGGQDSHVLAGHEKTSYRFLHPSYLYEPRPQLVSVPEDLTYGTRFALRSTGALPAEAVLMGLGSMTHSFDFNQRYVQLALVGTTTLPDGESHLSEVVAPATAQLAPPGHYMLFVLDAQRVPSVARIVHLQ